MTPPHVFGLQLASQVSAEKFANLARLPRALTALARTYNDTTQMEVAKKAIAVAETDVLGNDLHDATIQFGYKSLQTTGICFSRLKVGPYRLVQNPIL
jgi:hypothetical protein